MKTEAGGGLIAAVDIGGTKIALGLVGPEGRVVARDEVPTRSEAGFDTAIDELVGRLSRLGAETGQPVIGVGIGATGPIDPETGRFGRVPFFPEWEGCSPAAALSRAFGVSAATENDADAAALGEAAWGAGRNARRFIFVTVGTGIGGGIVLDGRLYRGTGGVHPELGHQVIEADGPWCTCGGRGCWEALASGPAIADWWRSQPSAVATLETMTAKDICELARRGDPLAVQAVAREGRYLGVGLANLITMFAPDLIALGGSVMASYDLFADAIRATVSEQCRLVPWNVDAVRFAALGADAGLVGAAEVWRHRVARQPAGSPAN